MHHYTYVVSVLHDGHGMAQTCAVNRRLSVLIVHSIAFIMKHLKSLALTSALYLSQSYSVAALPHPIANNAELDERGLARIPTLSCPKPSVPLGGGGPFATRQGRMFQIQSKTQFFAGMRSRARCIASMMTDSVTRHEYVVARPSTKQLGGQRCLV